MGDECWKVLYLKKVNIWNVEGEKFTSLSVCDVSESYEKVESMETG